MTPLTNSVRLTIQKESDVMCSYNFNTLVSCEEKETHGVRNLKTKNHDNRKMEKGSFSTALPLIGMEMDRYWN